MLFDFAKAVLKHWISWTSGLIGVLLWIGGVIADTYSLPDWSRRSFFWAAGAALICSFYSVWYQEHKELIALRKRITGFPKLKLAASGFHADTFFISQLKPQEPYSVLRLRITNDPSESTPESIPGKVRAGVSFFSEDGAKLLEIDGRWTDSPQPNQQNPALGVIPYLTAEFPIGQSRNIDIATKRLGEAECYAVSNDSFSFLHLQNPNYRLPPGILRCEVRLRGEYVDETFALVFRSQDGPLEPISSKQVSPV